MHSHLKRIFFKTAKLLTIMASEIIDILHRLSYQVDDKPIAQANGEIQKSIDLTKKLETANADLKKEIDATADATKKMDLQKTYQKNKEAIKELKTSIKSMGGEAGTAVKKTTELSKGMSKTGKAAKAMKDELKNATTGMTGLSSAGKLAEGTIGSIIDVVISPVGLVGALTAGVGVMIALTTQYGSFEAAVNHLLGGLTDQEKAQKALNEVNERAASDYSQQLVDLRLIAAKLTDITIPEGERVALLKQYNKHAAEQNRIDLNQINNLELINQKINNQIELIKKRAMARAAESVIAEKYTKYFLAQINFDQAFPEASNEKLKTNLDLAQKTVDDAAKKLGIKEKVYGNELAALADLPLQQIQDMAKGNSKFTILLDTETRKRLQTIERNIKRVNAYREGTHEGSSGSAAEYKRLQDLKRDADQTFDLFSKLLDINSLIDQGVKSGGKTLDNQKNKFALPFLSSIDETAIKNYRDKLKETLAVFDAHWADYKTKAAQEYKDGIISKKEFDDRMLALEALRLNKVKELLDNFAKKNPYVQFFKDQQTDINKQLAPIINDLKIKLPDKAALAPMSKAWQDYVKDMNNAADNSNKPINKFIDGYNQITSAAINAFSTITSAQQQETDAQLSIEEKRIQRAQQIADRGNAEALQAEEERQDKLLKQREQYARQQLFINETQTASAAALAIAEAAAAGAFTPGGVGAVAGIAAIIAGLAAGFAIVKTLTKDVPGFKEGIIDLQGPGTSKSDSIPARLSKHESIMTADATKDNKELLERMNRGEKIRAGIEAATMKPVALPIHKPFAFIPAAVNYGNQDKINRHMLSELKAIKQTIANKKESSMYIDRRGVAAITVDYIEETKRRRKL